MTDVATLDDLALAIASSSPKIKAYAVAQAAATQSQELDIQNLSKDFGAVGDGVADDTAEIQMAFSAGGLVYLPPGTYRITAALTVNLDNTSVVGPGVIKRGFSSGQGTIVVTADHCLFRDITIDGQRAAYTGVGIQVLSDYARLENVTLRDCTYQGVNLTGASHCFVNCQVYDCGGQHWPGIYVSNGSRRNLVSGCRVVNTLDGIGIGVNAQAAEADVSFNSIVGCYVESGRFNIEIYSAVPTAGCVVADNICVTRQTGQVLNGGISISGAQRCVVSGNTYDSNGAVLETAGIEIVDSPGCLVTGNHINGDLGLRNGIWLNNSSRCSITGNTLDGFGGNASPGWGGGIHVMGYNSGSASDNTVMGNAVNAPASGVTDGIRIWAQWNSRADRNLLSGNIVRGNGGGQGISLLNNGLSVDRTLVVGNMNTNVITPIARSGDTNSLVPAGTNQA